MNNSQIKNNINTSISNWYLNQPHNMPRAIVCILCDCFIIPDNNLYLSLEQLNKNQTLFYSDPQFEISQELQACYQISFPNFPIARDIKNTLHIEKCLLSPRSSFVFKDINENGFSICSECNKAISKGKRPRYSIANNFCFGYPPQCLIDLTEVEKALISPIKTFGYCFCYTGGQNQQMVGSLAYYKTSSEPLLHSIANLAAANANVIIIIYGEVTKKQLEIARKKTK